MSITEKVKQGSREIEMLKSGLFVDTIDMSNKQSQLAKKETKDCVVRAFMAALDITYDQAHVWVKEHLNRIDKRGTQTYAYAKNIIGKTKNGYKIEFMGFHPSKQFMNYKIGSDKILINNKYKKQTGYTLKSFIENNPIGRFVLIVQGHAVAVVDGVLYANTGENIYGLYRSVWMGFKFK